MNELKEELDRAHEALRKGGDELQRAYSDLREMRAQLSQIQKMAALGQMCASIAHEINNPVGYILTNLSSIRGYARDLTRLLRMAVEGASREDLERAMREADADFLLDDLQKAIDDSLEGARRVIDIVHSLRDFTHVDGEEMAPADLNSVMENTIRICWNEIKYKATVYRDYGRLAPVVCSAARIGQAFMNLLLNAAHAIEQRGEIHVATGEEDGCAVVRVRDTGRGIAAEHLPKIFGPFFTTKPVGQGTGLGLHMVEQAVQAHGGTIEVRSEVGRGTEFVVRLPLSGPRA